MLDTIFSIAILIMSVVVHEVSHGYAANYLGDPTARLQGRLTLNPIKHLDPIGSVFFPLVSFIFGGFIFGWAKPVPFNPYNLRSRKWGELIVAIVGPISNILLALIFAAFIRLVIAYQFLPMSFLGIAATIVIVNLVLGIFNLVPIPPLDGSKVLFTFLPYNLQYIREVMERFSFFWVILFIFVFWNMLFPFISWLFALLTGISV